MKLLGRLGFMFRAKMLILLVIVVDALLTSAVINYIFNITEYGILEKVSNFWSIAMIIAIIEFIIASIWRSRVIYGANRFLTLIRRRRAYEPNNDINVNVNVHYSGGVKVENSNINVTHYENDEDDEDCDEPCEDYYKEVEENDENEDDENEDDENDEPSHEEIVLDTIEGVINRLTGKELDDKDPDEEVCQKTRLLDMIDSVVGLIEKELDEKDAETKRQMDIIKVSGIGEIIKKEAKKTKAKAKKAEAADTKAKNPPDLPADHKDVKVKSESAK